MTQVTATAQTKPATFGRDKLKPGAYSLDLAAVAACPLQLNGEQSNFIEVLSKLQGERIKEITGFLYDNKYVTENCTFVVSVPHESGNFWLLTTLKYLVTLAGKGVDFHRAKWLYYDRDWSRDADESNTFFVVFDGKIVDEASHFSSEEPKILKVEEEEDEPIWHSHPYFDEAWQRYWYRKFYVETITGQLMLLRPDEPILYYYERPQIRDVARDVQFVTLIKIYRLLWVVLPLLTSIAFPTTRVYMAVAAGVLVIDLLWRCWATRKVGEQD